MKRSNEIIKILKSGGVGIIPTDTLYGVVGSALKPETLKRIYKVRERDLNKPLIILISSTKDLDIFGVENYPKILDKSWPAKVTIILKVAKNLSKLTYLHRGTKTLAFRIPKNKFLVDLLRKTGPLVAPSANPQGEETARNISEAKKYFGDNVDFYYGKKTLKSNGSTIIKWDSKQFLLAREGDIPFRNLKF